MFLDILCSTRENIILADQIAVSRAHYINHILQQVAGVYPALPYDRFLKHIYGLHESQSINDVPLE